jgi:signal transduction histidine kinase
VKLRGTRTAVAFVLTAIALALPCVAWYVVGRREVERRGEELEDVPRGQARETAGQLGKRVLSRLETLRDAESRRPFYHYQSFYHDPKGASEGASVVPSPLAQVPSDPLIRAYFQIDATGQLTMPTLSEQIAETNASDELARQRRIQQELAPALTGSSCVAKLSRPPASQQTAQAQKTEILDPAAWAQNVQASKLYQELKSGNAPPHDQSGTQSRVVQTGQGEIRVDVGDFVWCTVTVSNTPTLVALRTVTTPDGTLVQGFMISSAAIEESLKGSMFPCRFETRAQTRPSEIAVPIGDTVWRVVVDATDAINDARQTARELKTEFLQLFTGGVVAASVAGLCVVGLVWQTERLARQRAQLAASAAHELRTPLAGLRMYAEMLAEGLGDPTHSKDYAHRLADEAARLGRVVSNLLGFTRLERGLLTVRRERGDLAATIRDCVTRQQPALEANGARVELAFADDLPGIAFDRDAVAQIVQNLLDNAEKHTRGAADRTIRVALVTNHDGVVLTVADHGPGVPQRVRRRLFLPFARGGNSDAPAGLGLGLVLVKALARAHRGRIDYSDAPNGGAVFTVTFPN